MKFELKSLKISKAASHDSTAFSATLYADGVRAANVSNQGYGELAVVDYVNDQIGNKIDKYVSTLPAKVLEGKYKLEQSISLICENMVATKLVEQNQKRDTKTGILYRVDGQRDWMKYGYKRGTVVTPKMRKDLVKEMEDDQFVAEIISGEKWWN